MNTTQRSFVKWYVMAVIFVFSPTVGASKCGPQTEEPVKWSMTVLDTDDQPLDGVLVYCPRSGNASSLQQLRSDLPTAITFSDRNGQIDIDFIAKGRGGCSPNTECRTLFLQHPIRKNDYRVVHERDYSGRSVTFDLIRPVKPFSATTMVGGHDSKVTLRGYFFVNEQPLKLTQSSGRSRKRERRKPSNSSSRSNGLSGVFFQPLDGQPPLWVLVTRSLEETFRKGLNPNGPGPETEVLPDLLSRNEIVEVRGQIEDPYYYFKSKTAEVKELFGLSEFRVLVLDIERAGFTPVKSDAVVPKKRITANQRFVRQYAQDQ